MDLKGGFKCHQFTLVMFVSIPSVDAESAEERKVGDVDVDASLQKNVRMYASKTIMGCMKISFMTV